MKDDVDELDSLFARQGGVKGAFSLKGRDYALARPIYPDAFLNI